MASEDSADDTNIMTEQDKQDKLVKDWEKLGCPQKIHTHPITGKETEIVFLDSVIDAINSLGIVFTTYFDKFDNINPGDREKIYNEWYKTTDKELKEHVHRLLTDEKNDKSQLFEDAVQHCKWRAEECAPNGFGRVCQLYIDLIKTNGCKIKVSIDHEVSDYITFSRKRPLNFSKTITGKNHAETEKFLDNFKLKVLLSYVNKKAVAKSYNRDKEAVIQEQKAFIDDHWATGRGTGRGGGSIIGKSRFSKKRTTRRPLRRKSSATKRIRRRRRSNRRTTRK